MKEKGVVHILLAGLLLIFFIVAVITAIVVGLNKFTEEQGGPSLFNKDAKIVGIIDRFKEKKEQIINREGAPPNLNPGSAPQEQKKREDSIEDLRERIRESEE